MTNLQAALAYLKKGLSVIPIKGQAYAEGETEEDRYDDAKRALIKWEDRDCISLISLRRL